MMLLQASVFYQSSKQVQVFGTDLMLLLVSVY